MLGSGLSALDGDGAGYQPDPNGFGTPEQIGELFLTKFLVAFEVASLLLLIAAVGAVILARRRSGLDDPREISVADVMRGDAGTRIDAPTGTMIEAGGATLRFASILFALALFVELTIALVGTGLSALETEGAGLTPGFGTPAEVGELFLTKFLLAFELASLLLLIAAVGAVILARRRAGLGDPDEISVAELMRRRELTASDAPVGSMLEATGQRKR